MAVDPKQYLEAFVSKPLREGQERFSQALADHKAGRLGKEELHQIDPLRAWLHDAYSKPIKGKAR